MQNDKRQRFEVSFRDVKYPRLEFKTGKLLLVLPFGHSPEVVLNKHKKWIENKEKLIKDYMKEAEKKRIFKREEEELKELIRSFVKKDCEELKERVNKIFFRKMKTKWASCSKKRNLTINTLMKFLPDYLIEYIIFHEIAHLKERKHNKNFWKIVSRKFKNYEEMEKELFIYWFLIWEKYNKS